MSNYSKFFGSVIGGFVGMFVAWMASMGMATCTDVSIIETCTVFGLSTAQITTSLTLIFGALGTYIAPANA